jgi:hypothetical protein
MGTETNEALSALENGDILSEPLFGRSAKPLFHPKTEVRYFTGCLNDPGTREEAERLMTASLRCGGTPRKPGDVAVISESSNWDKEGFYSIAVKYLIISDGEPCPK